MVKLQIRATAAAQAVAQLRADHHWHSTGYAGFKLHLSTAGNHPVTPCWCGIKDPPAGKWFFQWLLLTSSCPRASGSSNLTAHKGRPWTGLKRSGLRVFLYTEQTQRKELAIQVAVCCGNVLLYQKKKKGTHHRVQSQQIYQMSSEKLGRSSPTLLLDSVYSIQHSSTSAKFHSTPLTMEAYFTASPFKGKKKKRRTKGKCGLQTLNASP